MARTSGAQGVAFHHGGKLGSGEHCHSGGDSELRCNRLLDAGSGIALSPTRRGKDNVAAVEQSAHVPVAEALDQRAKIRHRDPFRASDVDATQ
jgi:hypothetical protein